MKIFIFFEWIRNITPSCFINTKIIIIKGDYYLVEDVARDSETQEEMVVYRKLYDDGSLWVRSKTMFLSKVDKQKYPDVEQEYRFQLIEIKSKKK